MSKIITIFSHKGGVGKTTLVHNVGSLMANAGKKVLLIDADPQMNLTSAFAGMTTAVSYSDTSKQWLEFLDKYTNLAKFIKTATNSELELDKRFCEQTKVYEFKNGKQITYKNNGSLHLLPSVITTTNQNSALETLPSIEFHLAGALALQGGFASNTGILISRALAELKKEFDCIIIDTAPSASSLLNAVLLFSSDYFAVPVKPDFFSAQAVDNLLDVFHNWSNLLSSWMSTYNKAGLTYPKFLGIVPQMSKKFSKGQCRYALHAKEWNEHINKSILRFLKVYHQNYANYNLENTLEEEKEWFKSKFKESIPFIIQECVNFTDKLRTLAEQAAIPVCFLNDEICKTLPTGRNVRVDLGVTKITPDYQRTFKAISDEYSYIADCFIKL